MGDAAPCLYEFRAASAVTAAACFTLCSRNISCAGFAHLDNNDCVFCGVGSQWGTPTAVGASDTIQRWTATRGCNSDRNCVACPRESGKTTVETFRTYRASFSNLYLSESCLIYWPGDDRIKLGDPEQPIKLYSSSTITGPGTLRSPVVIVGQDVVLSQLTLEHPVKLEAGASVTLDGVTVQSGAAVVVAEIGFGSVTLNRVRARDVLVAAAHTEGSVTLTHCDSQSAKYAFLLQDEELSDQELSVTADPSCSTLPNVNLTKLMNVFGSRYEEMYFHDGHVGSASINVRKWLLRVGLANLAAAFVLFLTTENLRIVLYKLASPARSKKQS